MNVVAGGGSLDGASLEGRPLGKWRRSVDLIGGRLLGEVFDDAHWRQRTGRAGWLRLLQQRVGIDVIGEDRGDPFRVIHRGEEPRQQRGGETSHLQEGGCEAGICLRIALAGPEQPLSLQYKPRVVKNRPADPSDTGSDLAGRSGRKPRPNRHVHAGMVKHRPVFAEHLVSGGNDKPVLIGLGQQDDFGPGGAIQIQRQILLLDDGDEPLAVHAAALAARDQKPCPAGRVVGQHDTSQKPRRDQDNGAIRRPQGRFEGIYIQAPASRDGGLLLVPVLLDPLASGPARS